MLFEIKNQKLRRVNSDWNPYELEIEKYIIETDQEGNEFLSRYVFGEDLLLISNQVKTGLKKRVDILALDRFGNGVIVELKRDRALGAETQVLQYLAELSKFKGTNFIKHFSNIPNLEEKIRGFLDNSMNVDDINKNMRIILIARRFDNALLAMGEWLSNRNIPFKCISYSPVELENRRFISFSVVFDRAPETISIYPLTFNFIARDPGIFWHNIAYEDNDWWKFLVRRGQIPACFENSPGDEGERILKSYIKGDKIVAYASGYGAIGWGLIEDPNSYRLLKPGDKDDKLDGECLHRLNIKWMATANTLDEGISARDVREKFGIFHPLRTSVAIDRTKGEKLIEALNKRFCKG